MIQRAIGKSGIGPVDSVADFLPGLQAAVFELSAAEVKALFGTPITLVPAVANFSHIVEFLSVYKEPGTAYAAGGAFTVNAVGSASPFVSIAVAGFFDQTTAQQVVAPENASASYNVVANTLLGTGIQAKVATAELTTGTGRIFITLAWRTVPFEPIGI